MSNSDYSVVGSGSFCTIAVLDGNVGHLDATFTIRNLRSVGPGDRYVGMSVLIDDEIVRLESIGSTTITVSRGCADTLPAAHTDGAEIWFFDDTLAFPNVEYVASATIGVKIMPATTSSTMPIAYSPPEAVTFNSRFIRPYPPANLQINAVPWFTPGLVLDSATPALEFTWAQRNRVVQQDVLVGHTEGSITPEAGTTYTVKIHRADTNAVLRTTTGITGTSWEYTLAMYEADVSALTITEPFALYATMVSVRDSYESMQQYRIDFSAESSVDVTGFGWQGSYAAESAARSISSSDSVVTFTAVSLSSGFFGDRTKVAISGKVYCEFQLLSQTNNTAWHAFGLILEGSTAAASFNSGSYGIDSRSPNTSTGCGITSADGYRTNGTLTGSTSYAFGVGDRIGIAVDTATGKVWYRKNGTWISGDPGAGTGETHTLAAGTYRFAWMNYICGGSGSLTTAAQIFPSAATQTGSMPAGFSAYAV